MGYGVPPDGAAWQVIGLAEQGLQVGYYSGVKPRLENGLVLRGQNPALAF
jgi:hypothetical protein